MWTTRERTTAVAVTSIAAASLCVGVLATAAPAAPQVAPVNVDPPTITGTARVGESLTAQNGSWDNSPTEFRYRWLRCNRGGNSCVLLAADGQTYRLGEADVGTTLRVRVTAVNADGSANARSEQTDVVATNAPAPALNNTSRPTITGEARVGQELTASEGSWSGNPTSFGFQWQRCDVDSFTCADVVGATGKTYGVRLADLAAEPVVVSNVPRIRDVETMVELLAALGADASWTGPNEVTVDSSSVERTELDPELGREIRASFLLAGPLLARCRATVPPPGGDVIGRRRLDTHFHAFAELGVEVELNGGYDLRTNGLRGKRTGP